MGDGKDIDYKKVGVAKATSVLRLLLQEMPVSKPQLRLETLKRSNMLTGAQRIS